MEPTICQCLILRETNDTFQIVGQAQLDNDFRPFCSCWSFLGMASCEHDEVETDPAFSFDHKDLLLCASQGIRRCDDQSEIERLVFRQLPTPFIGSELSSFARPFYEGRYGWKTTHSDVMAHKRLKAPTRRVPPTFETSLRSLIVSAVQRDRKDSMTVNIECADLHCGLKKLFLMQVLLQDQPLVEDNSSFDRSG